MEFLNAAMRHTGLYTGPEAIEPIVTCRLNSKFAFIETRTALDATNAMNLNNIPLLGNLLKIGRPSKYHGPITPHKDWQELITGPGFTRLLQGEVTGGTPLTTAAPHPAAAVSGGGGGGGDALTPLGIGFPPPTISIGSSVTSTGMIDPSTKSFRELFVGNTSPEMNAENLKEFIANALEKMGFLLPSSGSGCGSGRNSNPIYQVRINPRFAFIEFRSIEEAANCLNLNGIPFLGQSLKISRPAKYSGALVTHFNWDDILSRWMTGELKVMTSGPSSCVLMFNNLITREEELCDDRIYEEMREETREELSQYGKIKSIVIPRPVTVTVNGGGGGVGGGGGGFLSSLSSSSPSLSSSSSLHRGIGKVFIEMSTEEEAKNVLIASKGRTFDGRIVDVKYFPYEKFVIGDLSDPPATILTANGFIDVDTVLGNKVSGHTITMNTPTAAQLSSYAHLNANIATAAGFMAGYPGAVAPATALTTPGMNRTKGELWQGEGVGHSSPH
jgi:RNA recognition motif-containing protein